MLLICSQKKKRLRAVNNGVLGFPRGKDDLELQCVWKITLKADLTRRRRLLAEAGPVVLGRHTRPTWKSALSADAEEC